MYLSHQNRSVNLNQHLSIKFAHAINRVLLQYVGFIKRYTPHQKEIYPIPPYERTPCKYVVASTTGFNLQQSTDSQI